MTDSANSQKPPPGRGSWVCSIPCLSAGQQKDVSPAGNRSNGKWLLMLRVENCGYNSLYRRIVTEEIESFCSKYQVKSMKLFTTFWMVSAKQQQQKKSDDEKEPLLSHSDFYYKGNSQQFRRHLCVLFKVIKWTSVGTTYHLTSYRHTKHGLAKTFLPQMREGDKERTTNDDFHLYVN